MDLGLQGKIVLVTGGSKGIGEAITRTFLAEGASVANVNRSTAEGEALYEDGGWKLRGFSDLTSGSATELRGRGGFTADITVLQPGLADDFVEWQFDAYSW